MPPCLCVLTADIIRDVGGAEIHKPAQHNLTTTTNTDYMKQIPPKEQPTSFYVLCLEQQQSFQDFLEVMLACFLSICKHILLQTQRVNLLLQVQGVREGLRGLACRVCHFYHLGHGDPERDEVEKQEGQSFTLDASSELNV